ncbi:hypothetical protein [Mycolicibacterium bacteremicum]|uniref:hypothetical protein n=1 Tax=Mycolicibacterium bacteremicum TaxID=564198 RepID=UPI0026EEC9AA|nr:hypothetical protein [Mycolicibacterium bacteremicum]
MAYFTLTDIDYDQSGGGLAYAIPEFQNQLPINVRATRQLPGSDRDDYFFGITERALKFHPQPGFDWTRAQRDFVGVDEAGHFLVVRGIIICSLFSGTQIHSGMRDFAVRVAVVVDNTLHEDERLSFEKCEYVGQGTIDDLPTPPQTGPAATR